MTYIRTRLEALGQLLPMWAVGLLVFLTLLNAAFIGLSFVLHGAADGIDFLTEQIRQDSQAPAKSQPALAEPQTISCQAPKEESALRLVVRDGQVVQSKGLSCR
jgi:hypothetical protein